MPERRPQRDFWPAAAGKFAASAFVGKSRCGISRLGVFLLHSVSFRDGYRTGFRNHVINDS
jgi:hypothetical protein